MINKLREKCKQRKLFRRWIVHDVTDEPLLTKAALTNLVQENKGLIVSDVDVEMNEMNVTEIGGVS